jgi:ketosteroid isomerase-like protein
MRRGALGRMGGMSETTGTVPEAVQRMIDATNAADTDAFVDAFTDDAYLEDWGRGFHGHDGVRSWDRTDNIGKRSHFEALGSRRDGDDDIVTLRVSGDGFNGTSDIRFTVRDGRIARMLITP